MKREYCPPKLCQVPVVDLPEEDHGVAALEGPGSLERELRPDRTRSEDVAV
jgi:hypothetical protein